MTDFKDQVVIVTGGTRGIGRGIAESFLHKGAYVVVTYVGNQQAADNFVTENSEFRDKIDLQKFDVSNINEVEAFFGHVESQYQKADILVNNSGIRMDSMTPMMSEESWDKVIDINLKGTFLMSKFAIPLFMKNRYGRIINISSIGGQLGLPGQANYAASKAGQIALAKTMSKEVAKKGITVNCVCPGFIETELIGDLPADQVKEYKKSVPMKRFGKAKEVADAVCFLASSNASYITGTTLEVTGGL